MTIGNGGNKGEPFNDSLQIATPGQTIFNAEFSIQRVFVDSIPFTTGYSGQGTRTITFVVGRNDGQEIYLTT